MSTPIPLITCGKHSAIATAVKKSLQPEYEAIHMILSLEAGVLELPVLLRGEKLSPGDPDNIGTKNYSKQAEAILVGGGYDEAMVSEMREACKGVSKVPWLRLDKSKPMPEVGPAYGAAVVERSKSALGQLAKEGKMGSDGLYFY